MLPVAFSSRDTTLEDIHMDILNASTDNITYGIVISQNLKGNNKEDTKLVLQGIIRGACRSAEKKGLICSSSDTTIDNVECRKIILYEKDPSVLFTRMYGFYHNDKVYMFTFTYGDPTNNEKADQELKQFLNNIRFGTAVAVKSTNTTEKTTAYKIGYALGSIAGIALIVGVVWLIVRFFRRKRK
jgi:hypothetical protein